MISCAPAPIDIGQSRFQRRDSAGVFVVCLQCDHFPVVYPTCLQKVISNGIGVHSGALTHDNRRQIESLFRSGQLPVLCTTTTLAQGVNLPAHLVIVCGTKSWKVKQRQHVEPIVLHY